VACSLNARMSDGAKGHGLQERLVAERDGRPPCIVVVALTTVGGVAISGRW